MKKIIFSVLAASMLMSFTGVELETTGNLQISQQMKSAGNSSCSYVISGYGNGVISVSTGRNIPVNGAFSVPISVTSDFTDNQPVTATIPSGIDVSVNGVPVACGSATSVQFYNTCYFTGGSCGDQP